MIIVVEGKTAYGASPAEYMEDMLRYDSGTILSLVEFEPTGFIAVIQCARYTPDRWSSFMLVTRESFHNFPLIIPASDYDYEPDEDCRDCGHLECCGDHNEDCYFYSSPSEYEPDDYDEGIARAASGSL